MEKFIKILKKIKIVKNQKINKLKKIEKKIDGNFKKLKKFVIKFEKK